MDPRIAMMGQPVNVLGALNAGNMAAMGANELRRGNALEDLYRTQGPGILSGDPGALNALAGMDPMAALGVQNTRQGMAFDAERMQMARDEAKRRTEDALRNANAAEVAKEAAEAERLLRGLVPAWQAGQSDPAARAQFDAMAGQMGITFDTFPQALMMIDGGLEAMKGWLQVQGQMQPQAPDPLAGAPSGYMWNQPGQPGAGVTAIPGSPAAQPAPEQFRPASPDEAARYGAVAGQFGPDGRFYPNNPPSAGIVMRNPDGTEVRIGGPAGAADKAERQAGNRQVSSDTVITAARRARELIGGATTGLGGMVMGAIPISDAAEINRQVAVLKSNASVSALQAMRDASPTGGALGSVTERENAMLADAAGALDPTAGPARFAEQLDNYERTLLRVVHGPAEGDRIFFASRAGGQAPVNPAPDSGSQPLDPATLDLLDPETRAWFENYIGGATSP